MKTLNLRRHSTKDGEVRDTIGPKGIALALRCGEADTDTDVLAHGPLVRTAQTAVVFGGALGRHYTVLPVVTGLGSDELFAQMITPEWKAAVASGKSNFQALVAAHGLGRCQEWARSCLEAAQAIFAQIEDGETGTGFFHSPTVELVAWAALGFPAQLNEELDRLGDCEGVQFTLDENGDITVGPRITTPTT